MPYVPGRFRKTEQFLKQLKQAKKKLDKQRADDQFDRGYVSALEDVEQILTSSPPKNLLYPWEIPHHASS